MTTRLPSLIGLVALGSLLSSCSLLGGEDGTFEGVVAFGFEVQEFRPCEGDEDWWLAGGEAGDELYTRYTELVGTAEYAPVYARVSGRVSGRGEYGHVGAYDREIEVEDVVEVRTLGAGECE